MTTYRIGQEYTTLTHYPLVDEDTSLLSVALTLRPLKEMRRPRPLGRAAHALLLRAISWSSPALAEAVHKSSGPKPFTVSGIFGFNDRPTLRMTALTLDVARALGAAIDPNAAVYGQDETRPLAVGTVIDLDRLPFLIEAVTTRHEDHPWAGQTSYGSAAMPWVYGQYEPDKRLAFEFASPTTFKSNGMNVPVPMPGWVFGSLLQRWNAFAPLVLPQDVHSFAIECMALSRYELKTVAVPFKRRSFKIGAMGCASYTARHADEGMLSSLNLLAAYAFFAGVGAQTTMGLGQCRQVLNF